MINKKSRKTLESNEIRAVKINRTAINELLNETILDYLGQEYFDVNDKEDDIIFRIIRDDELNEISFYICKYSEDNIPDFEMVDNYINENVKAVDSVFLNDINEPVYTVIKTEDLN